MFTKLSHFRGKIEFIFGENKFISLHLKESSLFKFKLKYKVLYIYILHDVAGSLKITISMH